jgi:hypothetical protein
VAKVLYEDVLRLRLESTGLKALNPKNGFIADLKTKTFRAADGAPAGTEGTAWVPSERVARAWQAMVTEKPFDP